MTAATEALNRLASEISDGLRTLKELERHDTEDRLCGAAIGALEDAEPYIQAAIWALAEGEFTPVGGT